jgi:hypothetical protein
MPASPRRPAHARRSQVNAEAGVGSAREDAEEEAAPGESEFVGGHSEL